MHVATATAPGSTHVNPGQPGKINNQDIVTKRDLPDGFIAVLCDGCSSQPYSGTGADIGANLIANILANRLRDSETASTINWESVTKETTSKLGKEVKKFANDDSASSFEKAVVERFLFTAMIVIVIKDELTIASFGDGVAVIDDDVIVIKPPILNSPPYLGYLLLNNSGYHNDNLRDNLNFKLVRTVSINSLIKGVIVGTDGLANLLEEDLHHPALVQSGTLQRWLNTQTAEQLVNGKFIAGKCHDDVTLIVIRSNEAQKRLFESRSELANLKQQIRHLEQEIEKVNSDLDETRLSLVQAETKIATLAEKLATATAKAEILQSYKNKIDQLREKLEQLRQDAPRKAKPIYKFFAEADKYDYRYNYPPAYQSGQKYHFPSLHEPVRPVIAPAAKSSIFPWKKRKK